MSTLLTPATLKDKQASAFDLVSHGLAAYHSELAAIPWRRLRAMAGYVHWQGVLSCTLMDGSLVLPAPIAIGTLHSTVSTKHWQALRRTSRAPPHRCARAPRRGRAAAGAAGCARSRTQRRRAAAGAAGWPAPGRSAPAAGTGAPAPAAAAGCPRPARAPCARRGFRGFAPRVWLCTLNIVQARQRQRLQRRPAVPARRAHPAQPDGWGPTAECAGSQPPGGCKRMRLPPGTCTAALPPPSLRTQPTGMCHGAARAQVQQPHTAISLPAHADSIPHAAVARPKASGTAPQGVMAF